MCAARADCRGGRVPSFAGSMACTACHPGPPPRSVLEELREVVGMLDTDVVGDDSYLERMLDPAVLLGVDVSVVGFHVRPPGWRAS